MSIFSSLAPEQAASTQPSGQPAPQNITGQPIQQPSAPREAATVRPTNAPSINVNGHSGHDSVPNDNGDITAIIRNTTLAMGGKPPAGQQSQQQPQQQQQPQPQQQLPQQSHQQVTPPSNGTSTAPFDDPNNTEATKRADHVITNFLRMNPLSDPMAGIDKEALTRGMAEGNIDTLMQTVSHAADNASRNAMRSFMLMMPSLVDTIKAQVLSSVQSMNDEGQVWNRFTADRPEFEALRHVVEPALKTALRANPEADRNTVFTAVAQMYDSMVSSAGLRQPVARNGRQSTGGGAFDLNQFLGG